MIVVHRLPARCAGLVIALLSAACSGDADSGPGAAGAGGVLPDAGSAANGGAGGSTSPEAGSSVVNLVENGDFATGTDGWTAQHAALSVEAGALRVETSDADDSGVGPGLAYQIVATEAGKNYRLTADLLDATYDGSNHVRAGRGINLDDYGTVYGESPQLVFTATNAELYITLNNVAATDGEYALFDNVVLVELPD